MSLKDPIRRWLAAWLLLAGLILTQSALSAPKEKTGVQIKEGTDSLRVDINGKLFTEYHFKDVPRPYFYPLIGPGELPMTRNWPMNSPEMKNTIIHTIARCGSRMVR